MTAKVLRWVFTRVGAEIQEVSTAETKVGLAREEWERRKRSVREWKELMQRL